MTRVEVAAFLVEKVMAPALSIRGANLYPLVLFSKTLYEGLTGGRYGQDSCEYFGRSSFDLFLPRICLRPQKFWYLSATIVALLLVPWVFPKQAPGHL